MNMVETAGSKGVAGYHGKIAATNGVIVPVEISAHTSIANTKPVKTSIVVYFTFGFSFIKSINTPINTKHTAINVVSGSAKYTNIVLAAIKNQYTQVNAIRLLQIHTKNITAATRHNGSRILITVSL